MSSSITDTVKPPKIAGATLSGCPSIAVANSRIAWRSSTLSLPESVYQAIYGEELDVYSAINKLNEKTGVPIPKALAGIKEREILHKKAIDKTEIISFIKSEIEAL